MTDYREISQAYARGGIIALTTANGGAAITLLSQTADLLAADLGSSVVAPLLAWGAGVASALIMWMMAFLSTRFVDKSERDVGLQDAHIRTSNNYMRFALSLAVFSVFMFILGCVTLACAFA